MDRTVQPELLDSLTPDHPDALHNRRDLRLTNLFMGNHRWFARVMPLLLRPDEAVLELGAGTGELTLRLRSLGIAADGLDLWPPPAAWPDDPAWHQADLQTFAGLARYPAVIGNLIFHQFSDADLARLGARLSAHARVIVASEPVRRRAYQAAYRLAGPVFGANHVSLHDAHVSIAAGFRGDELPRALGLDPVSWELKCDETALGASRMMAVRRS